MDLEGRGRGAGAEGERGGEWEAGSRRRGGAGDLIPRRRRREGAAGTHPCSDPGRGNRERRRQGEAGRFGRVGQVAGAVASWAFRPRGKGGVSSFSLSFPFLIFMFCFI